MLAYNFYTKKTWTPLLLDQKNQGGPEPLQGGPWTPGLPQMAPLSPSPLIFGSSYATVYLCNNYSKTK